jgi:hypothetical protein
VLILRRHTFWHAWWDHLTDQDACIHDVMDVTMDDLSPEQQMQLKYAIDQFQ